MLFYCFGFTFFVFLIGSFNFTFGSFSNSMAVLFDFLIIVSKLANFSSISLLNLSFSYHFTKILFKIGLQFTFMLLDLVVQPLLSFDFIFLSCFGNFVIDVSNDGATLLAAISNNCCWVILNPEPNSITLFGSSILLAIDPTPIAFNS